MTWTPERIEQAKALWISGLSAGQIAAELGGLTRSAVVGKIFRAGLKRGQPQRTKPKRLPIAKRPDNELKRKLARGTFAKPPKMPKAPPPRPIEAPPSLRLSLLDLAPHQCHWPEGDGPFFFCGHDRKAGFRYCEWHAKAAYRE